MNEWLNIILIIVILTIPAIAQVGIMINYKKYKGINNKANLSGFEVARKILDANGLSDMDIVSTPGNLTDHYDPSRKVVRLSQEVFDGTTVASTAIAAHECGHAIQDKEGYVMMRIRSAIVPIVNIGTKLSYAIILIGLLFEAIGLVYVGIALTSLGLLFQIITLPVEFDASKRAKVQIDRLQIATIDEEKGVKKVLKSAAMTYVAGVLSSILQVLRLVLMFTRRD